MGAGVSSFVLKPLAFASCIYEDGNWFLGFTALVAVIVLSELVDKMLTMASAIGIGIPVSEFINAWMYRNLYRSCM
jgi:hypothetical protein